MHDAVAVPRFHSEEVGKLFVEPSCPEEVSAALTAQGYQVERTTYMACVQALRIDPTTGLLSAGADPRAEGGVAAWPGGLA
jgi:gamma-glutamyltranspeptidase